ncbi:MAG: acyl-CoA carboxylase subunit beta [Syntrophomonadaceae bacterium]|jgi:acetyl-CoA carboxylase carboxyltransferase component
MASRSDIEKVMEAKIEELNARKASIINYASEKQLEERFRKHRMTARQRIETLLDPGTFNELDIFVTHHCTNFGMDKRNIPAEGVISGFGKIDGRQVFVYSQDFMALGGSFGEMHGNKILKVMQRALEAGAPVIGLLESGGLRLHEVMGPMVKFGELFHANTVASGVIPQISAILGSVAGGQAYSPGLTDFIIMTQDSAMYIAGPSFVETQLHYKVTEEELGGAAMHARYSGVADIVTPDEETCLTTIKELLSYLPSSNREKPPYNPYEDTGYEPDPGFYLGAANSRKPFDMHKIIYAIVDNGQFFRIKDKYARSMITGFARINGHSIGIVANQSLFLSGSIDCRASEKAARFVRFCDSFNIPIITLQDSPAYLIGKDEERNGIITRGAKLLHAYSEATVPMITIMVRNAYAGAQIAMGSKMMGADYVYAWPTAEIASVGADTAASIIFRKEILEAEDPEKAKNDRIEEYTRRFLNPYYAASRQDIDDVIHPGDTRQIIIAALEACQNKQVLRPWKKHSNIPL